MPHPTLSVRSLVAVLAAAPLAASVALAGDLPTPVGDRASISGRITPAGDVDKFALDLLPGDQVVFKVKDGGPEFGLLSTLRLLDPEGADTGVAVSRQSTPRPSFKFTAEAAGTHVVSISGDPGGFAGATGNYTVKAKIKRAKPGATKLDAPPGGSFAVPIGVTDGALLDIKLTAKKGGADVTGLFGPDGAEEPGFLDALQVKGRSRYQAKKLPLSGGFGEYELRGAYDAGTTVKIKVKVRHDSSRTSRSLADLEPRFDPFLAPFPREGVPVVTLLTVVGQNLVNAVGSDGTRYPVFTVGGVTIDPATIENPLDQVYRFPVPAGIAIDTAHAITLRNADGQGDIAPGAFTYVPLPTVFGLTQVTAGPAGGRNLRIVGEDLRAGSVVIVDTTVVQPSLVLPNRMDIVAPPHAPGVAAVVVRDEFGRSVESPQPLTYLDVGSNSITSVTPSRMQGVGGQTATVDGADFGDDTVLTFDGAPLDVTRVSASRLTFRIPPHAGGQVQVRVEDSLEQSSAFDVTVAAFTDGTAARVPAPKTGTGVADGWRATRTLVGRINGDLLDDLVIVRPAAAFGADAQRSRVRVLLADGSGGYTDGTAGIPAITATDDWRAVDAALADVDGRNGLDILLLTTADLDNGNRSSLRVLLNDGTGSFTDGTAAAMPATTAWGDRNQGFALAVADVDGQNGPDVVIVHDSHFQQTVDESPPLPVPPPEPPPEPIIVTYHYPATRVLVNDGTGVFTRDLDAIPAIDGDSVETFRATTVAAADVNGTGGPDIVISGDTVREDPSNQGTYLRRAVLLLNDGTGTFSDTSASRLPAPASPDYLHGDRVHLVDFDGNGSRDLVVTSNTRLVHPASGVVSTSPALRIYSNDGSGTFTRVPVGTVAALSDDDTLQCQEAAFGDLTGDGRRDIVLVSTRAPRSGGRAARVLIWTGSAFTDGSEGLPHPVTVDDGRGGTVVLHDVDGDGDLDVVIGRDEPDETVRNTRILVNPRVAQ